VSENPAFDLLVEFAKSRGLLPRKGKEGERNGGRRADSKSI
jgi:hypothetical protein